MRRRGGFLRCQWWYYKTLQPTKWIEALKARGGILRLHTEAAPPALQFDWQIIEGSGCSRVDNSRRRNFINVIKRTWAEEIFFIRQLPTLMVCGAGPHIVEAVGGMRIMRRPHETSVLSIVQHKSSKNILRITNRENATGGSSSNSNMIIIIISTLNQALKLWHTQHPYVYFYYVYIHKIVLKREMFCWIFLPCHILKWGEFNISELCSAGISNEKCAHLTGGGGFHLAVAPFTTISRLYLNILTFKVTAYIPQL